MLAILVALVLILGGCERRAEPSVVLYVSADDHVARRVIAEFEKSTGIRVDFVGDTEAKKTAGLVQRIRAEADHPVADVFWSSEIFMTIALADEGHLEAHQSEATRDWPVADERGRWFGFAARARAIVFSPVRVAPADVPKTWMDAADPRFAGRLVMADPRFGTTGGHLGAMKAYWSDLPGFGAAYEKFIEGLAANGVRLLPGGNSAVVESVARGEADLGFTDTDDVWSAQAHGAKVELVYPRHNPDSSVRGGGTLLIPNTVARVKGGPHAEAAGKLIDFLLSARVERLLAESEGHNVPVRADLAREFKTYAVPDPLIVDWSQAASMRQAAIDEMMRTIAP